MFEQVKKLSVIITIAILFTVLVFSVAELIVERPDYGDFCSNFRPAPRDIAIANDCPDAVVANENVVRECHDQGGFVRYDYDNAGCSVGYECDTCNVEYQEAISRHRFVMFIVSSVLGLIAVIVGLHLKPKNEVMEWVYSGFIIGGLASIFIGTVTYFNDMDRFLRPIVMIAEIALVVWVGVKTTLKSDKKKSKNKK